MHEVAARHNLAPHLRAREDAVLSLLTDEALPFANNERKRAWRIWAGRKCPRRFRFGTGKCGAGACKLFIRNSERQRRGGGVRADAADHLDLGL